MANFILRAPDAEKRNLPDYRQNWQEFSYTETVAVINGIARCNDETTKHILERLGYTHVDPSLICTCDFVALDAGEFSRHAEECPKAREIEIARGVREAGQAPRTAREEGKARRAKEAHAARLARKEEKARRARIKRKVRLAYELIKTRLVCKDCGRVCMDELEFAKHIETCTERKLRL